MTPFQNQPTSFSTLLDDLSAGCDCDFDGDLDDLEREFAELRFTLDA